MKVETPQILWNAEGDGKSCINAALYSVSMVQSGIVDPTAAAASLDGGAINRRYGNVLATAGNSPLINLWKVSFPPPPLSPPPPVVTSSSSPPPLTMRAAQSSPTRSISNSSTMMYQRHERGGSSNNNNNHNNNSSPKNSGGNGNNSNNNNTTKIDYLCTLSRHEGAVNCVAFSPDGLHLATAGDKSGGVIVWSVPIGKRGNGNGRHYWSSVTRESDLIVRIVSCACEGVVDLSWSADSKRFLVGTIDSAVLVCEDSNYAANNPSTSNSPQQQQPQQQQQLDSAWKIVYRSKEHTHFVQGVSYDPLGVYLASMSNDRSVRIYPRKTPSKSKKKVLRPCTKGNNSGGAAAAAKRGTLMASSSSNNNSNNNNNNIQTISALPPADHARMVNHLLTETKLEVTKSKQIKQRKIVVDETTGITVKHNLFADESTLESFFRRLSWTTDGAFLVTPAVLWHSTTTTTAAAAPGVSTSNSPTTGAAVAIGAPSYATCLYARHHFDQPYKVFSGLEKPSLVVRANPVLFQLPENALVEVATKENASASALSPKNTASKSSSSASPASLPYKSIFCVLTNDSVLIYDTHHDVPLSVVRGLHYSNLADATWSQDGHTLLVCSTDGYLSILRFAPGELGKVYTPPPSMAMENEMTTTTTTTTAVSTTSTALGPLKNVGNAPAASTANSTASPPVMMVRPKKSIALAVSTTNINSNNKPLPPCEPGSEAVLEEPPQKRSKICHEGGGPLTVSAAPSAGASFSSSGSAAMNNKRPASVALEEGNDDHDEAVKAVDKLSLDNDNKKTVVAATDNDNQAVSSRPVVVAKKKKRVQPILLSSA